MLSFVFCYRIHDGMTDFHFHPIVLLDISAFNTLSSSRFGLFWQSSTPYSWSLVAFMIETLISYPFDKFIGSDHCGTLLTPAALLQMNVRRVVQFDGSCTYLVPCKVSVCFLLRFRSHLCTKFFHAPCYNCITFDWET